MNLIKLILLKIQMFSTWMAMYAVVVAGVRMWVCEYVIGNLLIQQGHQSNTYGLP